MTSPVGLGRLLEALSRPAAYPFALDRVRVCQTHISAVFLAGPFAYKIKKPVDFGFLDFSTLEKRRHFCAEEVRLNRRLAPDVYLGVVPVTRSGDEIRLEATGDVVEWAVKMQRLPEEATLEQRLLAGDVAVTLVETLARRIADFHRRAERTEAMKPFGSFVSVSRNLLDIFKQSAAQIRTTVSRTVFDRLKELTKDALERNRTHIDERAGRGMPRDCHGDLHLDHVYWFPERPPPGDLVIVDCIEFNERFRYIDPVADVAFAAMDFGFHGRRDLASAFADAWFEASGDSDGRPLLPMYTAYRASVRGSVEGLKLAEKEVPATERRADLQKARGHWLLALGELEEPVRRPCLVLVGGLPGTGKSTLARGLVETAGFTVIRSDAVRKELTHTASDIYTPEWTEKTFSECLRRAEELLFAGQRVLVDATFRSDGRRRHFLEAARSWGVPGVLLVAQADPETVRLRLAQRRHDISDADWDVYRKLAGEWEPASPQSLPAWHTITTEGSPAEAEEQALTMLRKQGLL